MLLSRTKILVQEAIWLQLFLACETIIVAIKLTLMLNELICLNILKFLMYSTVEISYVSKINSYLFLIDM